MSFTDYLFLPAFGLLSLLYFNVQRRHQWIILLCASLVFYSSWGGLQIFWMAGEVLVAWAFGLWISHLQQKSASALGERTWESRKEKMAFQKAERKKWRRVLVPGILLVLASLVLVKVNKLVSFGGISFIVPLGISYYTLSLIGYLADVYWRKEQAEKNPFRLLLFAAYFPKIIEGPISKHRDTAAQMFQPHAFDYQRYCFGLQRALWGYFKKLVIADRLAIFVDSVYGVYDEQRGAILLLAAIASALQMYCDFSGCMDIALGISDALGITLEENFNHPFFSRSVGEFWRRWHMSLNSWFRDYVFMPIVVSPSFIRRSGKLQKKLGKETGKAVMNILPLLLVWLMTGLWHGTGWNYLLWGAYWAVLMILSSLLERPLKRLTALLKIPTQSRVWKAWQCARTFVLFTICRIIASQSSIGAAWTILRTIVTDFAPLSLTTGILLEQGLNLAELIGILPLLLLLWFVSARQEKGVVFREKIAALPIVPRWIVYFLAIFFVLIFGIYGATYDAASFVYQGF